MPRAARIGLPAYSNEVILMLKASSLASTVTLVEITGMARTLSSKNYMPLEMYFAAGVCYLLLSFFLVQIFRVIEKKLRVDSLRAA